MIAVVVLFWASVALLVYTQVGYGLLLAALRPVRRTRSSQTPDPNGVATGDAIAGATDPTREHPPSVSVIVAAYAEAAVISDRVANLKALDHPAEVIIACDGSPDDTAQRAREAGADTVLELPRKGKIAAQDAGVRAAHGEILAFGDANAIWATDALSQLLKPFTDPRVGYVCGDVSFESPDGTNQEGLYWRYEMWLRTAESTLSSITAGNGAIYAVRRETYVEIDPTMSHDLTFPCLMVKRGYTALYAPAARATEKMTPSIEAEFARKRRMATRAWPTVLTGGMLSPRGYGPLYALMILSHRLLRYASPLLHLVALVTSLILITHGWIYVAAVALQVLLLVATAAAPYAPNRLFLIARYYVLTTASLAAGLWDWSRGQATVTWEPVEGTR